MLSKIYKKIEDIKFRRSTFYFSFVITLAISFLCSLIFNFFGMEAINFHSDASFFCFLGFIFYHLSSDRW